MESSTVDGYRVIFGDNKSGGDEIRLQRVDDGVDTTILTSLGTVLNGLNDMGFMVRVTRTSTSEWTLYTSTLPTADGEGVIAADIPSKANTPVNQGSVTDDTYTDFTGGHFGFMAKHSSDTDARNGAEFDQLYFDTNSDSSLPVELSIFTVTNTEDGVILRWQTESETNNLGFWIYRGAKRDGKYLRITPVMLRGAGTSAAVHNYEFVDTEVEPGTPFYYYIEDVAFDGSTSRSPIVGTKGGIADLRLRLLPWGKIKQN